MVVVDEESAYISTPLRGPPVFMLLDRLEDDVLRAMVEPHVVEDIAIPSGIRVPRWGTICIMIKMLPPCLLQIRFLNAAYRETRCRIRPSFHQRRRLCEQVIPPPSTMGE